ncbi:MAG TPA: hypothetical protein VKT51_01175 [Candidatus Eremiobacteraceae bacterium]|nr:hypothetical protein [Candidatus Eremiobacteraceae bacterium]
MMNTRGSARSAFALVAGCLAVALLCAQARADLPTTGQWILDKQAGGAALELTLRSSGSQGSHTWDFEERRSIDRASLRGLSDAQLSSGGTHGSFRIVRDAGWFDCDGWIANGGGAGSYSFTPDLAFAQGLAARGIGSPTPSQSLRYAVAGIDLAYIDKLRSLGVSPLTPDDLVRMADHGVDAPFVSAMGADGFRFHAPDDLIRLRDHGVDRDYVASMRSAGYANLTADDLVRLRDHGVDPEFVASMAAVGYTNLSADDLVRLRDHGVDADFVKRMTTHGYSKLSVDDLIRLRDHGF